MINDTNYTHLHGACINVSDYFELRMWAKRFDVTAAEIRRAVTVVGEDAAHVEAFLNQRQPAVDSNALPRPARPASHHPS